MTDNTHQNTHRAFLGSTEIPKDRPKIEVFDSLFREDPRCELLLPVKMIKQTVSRTVIKPGFRTHFVGYFASRINQALITFESALEKNACTVFESYPELQSYRAQPYGVSLYFLDKFRTVYPDFELVLNDGLALVDIRYETNIHSPQFKARYWALKEYAQQRGIGYTLLTDEELMTERRKNARFLLSLCKGAPQPRLINTVSAWLHKVMPLDFNHLLTLTTAYPSVRAVIAGLILDGALSIDWDKAIHLQTLVPVDNKTKGSWLD
ncbi:MULTISPECIES: hypothetical protein [Methylophaga]|uniref:hypothetical protein n=1 Tax=Methylophaga TaxID=40222 RepID=UPI000C596783|nr:MULTISPECIES: hypothetical protein [Methylophaga]MAX51733.1 hypothetical protein [Methylophaga sp.]WVI83991.1 hypothetical protein VSX76_09415 [Methylophaga thalassica]